jgi:subtilase family serine protease
MAHQAAHPTFRLLNAQTQSAQPAVGSAEQDFDELDPQQMQTAYGVNLISFGSVQGTGKGQTIALIDAYNDPDIVSDAQAFSTFYGLPQFNGAGQPTFQVLTENGSSNLSGVPNASPGDWDVEESLDVEWAHSIAPQANIILYEANSNSLEDLLTADQTAAETTGVSAVSNSWSTSEFDGENSLDSIFTTPAGHQGVTFTASTGDSGPPAGWPAYSPNVVAVGGTALDLDQNADYLTEGAWGNLPYDGASSGGISQYESQPSYQAGKVNSLSANFRTVPDISMDADPATGVAVLDSYVSSTYFDVGGTSLASPMSAALIAIANQGRVINGLGTLNGQTQTLPMLYNMSSADYHDVTTGVTNDNPFADNGYSASFGYDLTTGLGSPIANDFVMALAGSQSNPPPTVTSLLTSQVIENGTADFGGVFSGTDGVATSTSDSLTLTVDNGTIGFSGSPAGLTFVSGTNNSSAFTVKGTVANLNAALGSLQYSPNFDYVGGDVLQISLYDSGDGLTGFAATNIMVSTISAPRVDPTPFQFVTTENQPYNLLQVGLFDQAANVSSESLSITVSNGTFSLATTAGLTFTSGSNDSSSMTVTGTLSSITAALAEDVATNTDPLYIPPKGFTGTDWLQISVLNNTDGLSDLAVPIFVDGPPAIKSPITVQVPENGSFSFPSASIALTDGAALNYSDTLQLAVAHGTLTLGSTTGLNVMSGSNDSSSMLVNGTLANLQAAVNGLVYTPTNGFLNTDFLALDLFDYEDTKLATGSTMLSVDVAPSITSPGSVSVSEN